MVDALDWLVFTALPEFFSRFSAWFIAEGIPLIAVFFAIVSISYIVNRFLFK